VTALVRLAAASVTSGLPSEPVTVDSHTRPPSSSFNGGANQRPLASETRLAPQMPGYRGQLQPGRVCCFI
jgi:hypothetical protein